MAKFCYKIWKEEEIKKISVRSGLITGNQINAIAVGRNHNIGLHNAVIFVCDNGVIYQCCHPP